MNNLSKHLSHPALRGIPKGRIREYSSVESCVFWYTSAEFGEFSNMAEGFPIILLETKFNSTEAVYQSAKFSAHPEIQRAIVESETPKISKLVARTYSESVRSDWLSIRVEIMRWVLRLKASQHMKDFLYSLEQTGERPIVEESVRDGFWGAVRIGASLYGVNTLGRLLMQLRDDARKDSLNLMVVPPPAVPGLEILGKLVSGVSPPRR